MGAGESGQNWVKEEKKGGSRGRGKERGREGEEWIEKDGRGGCSHGCLRPGAAPGCSQQPRVPQALVRAAAMPGNTAR